MKIHSHQEYTIAYEKAVILKNAGFGGNLEKEKLYRELIGALTDYEKDTPILVPSNPIVGLGA